MAISLKIKIKSRRKWRREKCFWKNEEINKVTEMIQREKKWQFRAEMLQTISKNENIKLRRKKKKKSSSKVIKSWMI